jgi:hypothetical protein
MAQPSIIIHLIAGQAAALAFVISGAALLWRGTDGAYWSVLAIVGCYPGAVVTAWILLIEINR